MKTKNNLFISLLICLLGSISSFDTLSAELRVHDEAIKHTPSFSLQLTNFYNELLTYQTSIEKINQYRPKIYIYTDFGGGTNHGKPFVDLQTSGEIASAGWKSTLQQEININDSATPLSPRHAALRLAATFPFKGETSHLHDPKQIQAIVVHVIDPGVGNNNKEQHPQPRSLVLRKDGILFIGPDNGTLTLVCPKNSIAGIWEIDSHALNRLSGIDVQAGGTFHGRDIFCEAAFRLAAGIVSLDEIGIPYTESDLKNRIATLDIEPSKCSVEINPIDFASLKTERYVLDRRETDQHNLFEQAFLLGIIQSVLYEKDDPLALTHSKKLFLISPASFSPSIAIINKKTGNTFIGPNNGSGTSFFRQYDDNDYEAYSLSSEILESILKEPNNEIAYNIIRLQPTFLKSSVKEIPFYGDESSLRRDDRGRPKTLRARLWSDRYGNLKTTMHSLLLNEAKIKNAHIRVIINGIERPLIFADTFSQVPEGQLFIYNGSSGSMGPNPHRSKRYTEISTNGTFGKFGIDYFEKEGSKPCSGDEIWIFFDYAD